MSRSEETIGVSSSWLLLLVLVLVLVLGPAPACPLVVTSAMCSTGTLDDVCTFSNQFLGVTCTHTHTHISALSYLGVAWGWLV